MKLCVIGTGYVGLVAGTCFAEMGNNVICVDKDIEKLEQLKQGIIPIYEPGLEDLIKTNVKEGRLTFSNNLEKAVKESSICFIAVGTPQNGNGTADLSAVFEVAEQIANSIKKYTLIVNKSTSPVGTLEKVKKIIKKNTNAKFDVASNPEFLKQGAAVDDFLKPDRIIIGSDSEKALELMKELYAPFIRTGNPVISMDTKSAEMVKYAANAFLATKISFANEIANICEKVGADVDMVRHGMCSDNRIGNKFLFAGLGYGGSCFPKDVQALVQTAKELDYSSDLLKSVDSINKKQRTIFINKIINRLGDDLSGKTFALWGLAFKPKTNDMREAPAITIIKELLKRGAKIKAFDPKAIDSARKIFKTKIEYATSAYDALEDADAMILATEWNEFRNPDFKLIKKKLKSPIIFDGRNQYNQAQLKSQGFEYYAVGK